MNKITLMAAGLALCTGAFATGGKWNAMQEANYRICQTLNGSERWAIDHELNELGGAYADVYYRAINKASEQNGGMAMAPAGWTANTWSGSDNQTMTNGSSMYAMTFQERMRMNGITDGQAWDMLIKGVNPAERGGIESTWPNLTGTCQEAILHVIKRSKMITPMSDDKMGSWK